MPKSTKAAPPQQANLQEMWGKKKEPTASKPAPDASKTKTDAMVVDTPEEKKGEMKPKTQDASAESFLAFS